MVDDQKVRPYTNMYRNAEGGSYDLVWQMSLTWDPYHRRHHFFGEPSISPDFFRFDYAKGARCPRGNLRHRSIGGAGYGDCHLYLAASAHRPAERKTISAYV